MSVREKFFRSVRRQEEGYVPYEFKLCPSLQEEFKKRYGEIEYNSYFEFPCRYVESQFTADISRYHRFHPNLKDTHFSDWGVGYKKGSVAHFTEMKHPMRDFKSLEEFKLYPYPDPIADYSWDEVSVEVNEIKTNDLVAVAPMAVTIFEMAWYLRGMDNLMIDMVMNPDLANYHMDRITEIRCEFARRYTQAGIDLLHLGDDVSTQLDMMMSPDMWRIYIKPRLEAVISAAKQVNPNILIFYHGDGNLQKIIPDLIEVGVEILNPIQPECMDPVEIKKQYGDKLTLWGTVGTQTTMPFGTVHEVRETCIKMIRDVGKGGGLVLAPTHTLEPEVPWENIQAFIDVVRDHNR